MGEDFRKLMFSLLPPYKVTSSSQRELPVSSHVSMTPATEDVPYSYDCKLAFYKALNFVVNSLIFIS